MSCSHDLVFGLHPPGGPSPLTWSSVCTHLVVRLHQRHHVFKAAPGLAVDHNPWCSCRAGSHRAGRPPSIHLRHLFACRAAHRSTRRYWRHMRFLPNVSGWQEGWTAAVIAAVPFFGRLAACAPCPPACRSVCRVANLPARRPAHARLPAHAFLPARLQSRIVRGLRTPLLYVGGNALAICSYQTAVEVRGRGCPGKSARLVWHVAMWVMWRRQQAQRLPLRPHCGPQRVGHDPRDAGCQQCQPHSWDPLTQPT